MEVGNVNSKHFVLALKVKRMPRTLLKMSNIWFGSRSGSPIVTWIPLILLMFYQIFQTVVLIEEIIDNLVKEGVLLKKGMTPMLLLIRTRNLNLNSPMRKKKLMVKFLRSLIELCSEDLIYVKALYYTLPLAYVSATKLQSSFQGEVNQTAARKIIDKMTRDGFLEPKGNKRLGKRVIHSELTQRKFIEVQKALGVAEAMDVDDCEPNSKSKQTGYRVDGSNRDISTCGVLHSIGSDLTRMKVTSDTDNTDSMSGPNMPKAKEPGSSPISRAGPVASRESFAHRKEISTANASGIAHEGDAADTIICSKSSQDKRPRKTSAVKEPIHQNMKRQKSQAT